jgi:hypothetical protein
MVIDRTLVKSDAVAFPGMEGLCVVMDTVPDKALVVAGEEAFFLHFWGCFTVIYTANTNTAF